MISNKFTQLKSAICKGVSELFDINCELKYLRIGSQFGDVTLSFAKAYRIDAKNCAQKLNSCNIVFDDINVIESAQENAGFVIITLSVEVLEYIADWIIKTYKDVDYIRKISSEYEYSVVRLHMLKNKSNDFPRIISENGWRKAFIGALILTENKTEARKKQVANCFLTAERKAQSYDGLGKYADAMQRLLFAYMD